MSYTGPSTGVERVVGSAYNIQHTVALVCGHVYL